MAGLLALATALAADAFYQLANGVGSGLEVGAIVAALSCAGLLLKFVQVRYARLMTLEEELISKNHYVRDVLAKFDATLNNMPQGVALYDRDQSVLLANRRYAEMYGLTPEDIKPGASMKQILQKRVEKGVFIGLDPADYVDARVSAMENPANEHGIERFTDGRVIEKSRRPMPGGGWLSVHEDVTERQRANDHIAWLARHDVLTRLANRVVLQERIEEAFLRIRRGGEHFAILLLDLDDFKIVNDTMGHPVGDRLLQAVADRLRATVRDLDLVARIGGDEFAVVQHADSIGNCRPDGLADRLMEAVGAPYELDGQMLHVHMSIGVAIAPLDGDDGGTLLKNADLALYQAKEGGRRCVRFFNATMDKSLRTERSLEGDLRTALASNEFEVHYQSVIDVRTGGVTGMEALARWRHPALGMIRPDIFIKLAEKTGLINSLGAWVLRTACTEAAGWPSDIKIAVNLSPAQFRSGDLVKMVHQALDASGLPPTRLTLEITETTVLETTDGNLTVLHELRKSGISIALDDFGTGYSSLSYLKTIPFDVIKIDRSFVKEMESNERSARIVAGIVALSRSLNYATVAEGIETSEQFELVRAAGCTAVQGFLFSKPKPARELDFQPQNVSIGKQAA